MATEEEKLEKLVSDEVDLKKGKSGLNPKIFLFGIPIFIIQLVVVYFVTANFLLSKTPKVASSEGNVEAVGEEHANPTEYGKFIYSIDDVIVNPAGSDGKRLLLASFGFDLSTEDDEAVVKSKEILLKDIILTTLSKRTVTELNQVETKDSVKSEILREVKKTLPKIHVNKIYLSKFILQ